MPTPLLEVIEAQQPEPPAGPSVDAGEAPAGEVSRLAEHLFRHEAGKLVSVLTGIFGLDRLQWAEDVVQEALVRALQTWPYYGVPKNPAAWLTQTAKNLALDLVRREKLFRDKEPEITTFMEQWSAGAASPEADGPVFDTELRDHRLRLMFACCHPLVPREAQTALALKTLCGFSVAEISRAFLTNEAVLAKRLTRAKQKIREAKLAFEIPAGQELAPRLDGVLQTLYLLFNEGYKASEGDKLIRDDLCREAIGLASALAQHPAGNCPRTHALLALMCLNAARSPARIDLQGNLVRLKEQDRALWDQGMIARGMFHLAQSAKDEDITAYHLQAGIAACHCAAKEYELTDWPRIVSLYDHWMQLDDSPVVALNRAVAVAHVHGPKAGRDAVEAIRSRDKLDSYYLLYAVLGDFEEQLNDPHAAAAYFRKSLKLAASKSERDFLSQRVRKQEPEQQWPADVARQPSTGVR